MKQHRNEEPNCENCYRLNRMFLSAIYLWPYDNETVFTKINRIIIFIMTLSTLFFQLTTLLTYEFSVDFFIVVSTYSLPAVICIVQYSLFYNKLAEVKEIWKNICDDLNALKDETERKIIRRYSHIATQKTIRLTAFLMTGMVAYSIIESSPLILDVILPLNEARPRKLLVLTEYFINDPKYFYPILCHWLIAIFIDTFSIIAIFMFYMMFGHHTCGLFKIVCYRLQHSMDGYGISNSQKDIHTIIERITHAIEMHRVALEHMDFGISVFTTIVLVDGGLIVTSLTLNLLRLLRSVVLLQNMQEMITSSMLVTTHLLMLLLANGYAQKVTEHHNKIFRYVYNVRWYKAPKKIQILLLFIMAKTTKPYYVNVYNIFTASLESFTQVLSLSISYFTVLYSLMT